MKVAIACYPTYGGSGVVATELGLSLAERGHEVHFLSYEPPPRLGTSDEFRPNVYFHEVQVTAYPLFRYPPYDLALASKMFQSAKSWTSQRRASALIISGSHVRSELLSQKSNASKASLHVRATTASHKTTSPVAALESSGGCTSWRRSSALGTNPPPSKFALPLAMSVAAYDPLALLE